ncbi:MAG: hypothetical protein WDW36_001064 [Sanguina aurantia]
MLRNNGVSNADVGVSDVTESGSVLAISHEDQAAQADQDHQAPNHEQMPSPDLTREAAECGGSVLGGFWVVWNPCMAASGWKRDTPGAATSTECPPPPVKKNSSCWSVQYINNRQLPVIFKFLLDKLLVDEPEDVFQCMAQGIAELQASQPAQ